jgi:hypothetical protein
MLYNRQRSLLALVDAFGGDLANTDLQKLLFLWTAKQPVEERIYDFVPYRFGAFSFTSYADRRKLIEKGLVESHEKRTVLTEGGRREARARTEVSRPAARFAASAPSLRGDRLVALTYRRFPFFATRSEIASRVLQGDSQALAAISHARPSASVPGVVTIGYEGKSLESYLVALLRDGVTMLCDVRRNPISRRYGFSKSALSRACSSVGIQYEHIPGLGIASKDRKGLTTQADFEALFEAYETRDLPQQGESIERIAGWVADGERVALTCYELDPDDCHRHCVSDALQRRLGRPAAHL